MPKPRSEKEKAATCARMKRYRAENPEKVRAWKLKSRQNLFNKILELYGRSCACCGENNKVFLTLDHINGGGRKHRNQVGGSVDSVYRDILKNGYQPNEYQVLCFNCNLGRERFGGTCPHELERVQTLLNVVGYG